MPKLTSGAVLVASLLGLLPPAARAETGGSAATGVPPTSAFSSTRIQIDALSQLGRKFGSQVLSLGTGVETNAVHVWKFYHGGISAIPFFKKHPEQFSALLKHQNALMELHTELIKVLGPQKLRVVLESYQANIRREDVDPERFVEMRQLEGRMLAARGSPLAWKAVEQELFARFSSQSDAREATTFLNDLSFPLRFTCYCLDAGYEQVLLASEPPNHPSLSSTIHRELDRLAARGDKVSDAELQAAIEAFKVAEAGDFRVRHQFVRDRVAEAQRLGQHVTVVLGGTHVRSGAQFPGVRPTKYPLEDQLLETPGKRVIVWDESHLPTLTGVDVATMGARALAIEDFTPTILRQMLSARSAR